MLQYKLVERRYYGRPTKIRNGFEQEQEKGVGFGDYEDDDGDDDDFIGVHPYVETHFGGPNPQESDEIYSTLNEV
jgi:hypothetical protein